MPKQQTARIIDIRRDSGTAAGAPLAAGSGSSGGGGVTSATAGAGLTYAAGALNVGAGTLVTVGADTVGITAGSTYQFIGTGSGTAASWIDLSTLAGDGLAHSSGVLAVNAGDGLAISGDNLVVNAGAGLSISADNLVVNAGDGLTFSSDDLVVGVSGLGLSTSADAVVLTSSSNPGAAASILASDADGYLTLVRSITSDRFRGPKVDTATGNLTLQPADDLLLDPVSNVVRALSTVALQSDGYASQTTGWRVTYDGQADFRYLYVDEMHAKSFIADLEQALAGGQIISKSVAMLAQDFTAPAASGTATLYVRDLPSAPGMAVFESGDIVRLRTFTRSGGSLTIADCWGTVSGYTASTNGTPVGMLLTLTADAGGGGTGVQSWTFTRSSTDNAGAMAAGTIVYTDSIVLDYGTTGNGFYEVNAIDGAYGANSPYAQTVTWASHPHSGQTVRTRMGNLYGITNSTEYGLYAGTGSDGTTDQYVIISDDRVDFNNIPITQRNAGTVTVYLKADGESRWGNDISGDNVGGTHFAIFPVARTYNSEAIGAGDIILGDHANGHVFWDASAGQLKFRESTTTQIYVDTDGILKAGSTTLSASGLAIPPTVTTTLSGTPDPSATPTTTPTSTKYVNFPDPAATWYNYSGGTATYAYAGGDAGRIYGYVEHIVPDNEDEGFWQHKSWLVLAAREPTLPTGTGTGVQTLLASSFTSEVYIDADILRPRADIRAGSSSGLTITDDAGNAGIVLSDGGTVQIDDLRIGHSSNKAYQYADGVMRQELDSVAIDNDTAVQISTRTQGLFFFDNVTDGQAALFLMAPTSTLVAGSGTYYSTSKDTASKVNVYTESGATYVQNKRGSAQTIAIWVLR